MGSVISVYAQSQLRLYTPNRECKRAKGAFAVWGERSDKGDNWLSGLTQFYNAIRKIAEKLALSRLSFKDGLKYSGKIVYIFFS